MAWMSVKVKESFGGKTDRALNIDSIKSIEPSKPEGSKIWFLDGSQIDVHDDYNEILEIVLTVDAKKAKTNGL